MADERDEIRLRADIVELVGHRVSLKKAGKNWSGLCPFHDDKKPSFTVSPQSGRYKCWSCGATGDVFDWVMNTQNVEFREALEILAKETGVELSRGPGEKRDANERERQEAAMAFAQKFFRAEYKNSPQAREYTQNRGLPQEVLDEWEIGYAPSVGEALANQLSRNGHSLAECQQLFLVDQDPSGGFYDRFRGRLMFPIRDERGRLVAFGGRIIGEGNPKYINSSDTPLYRKSKVLYGMNRAKEEIAKSRQAVLCEGYVDVIACHRAGVKNALASLGTTLAEDHVKLLKRWCDEVVILYDADAAGQKATDRACELLEEGGLRVRVALVAEGKDPDDLLETGGPEAVQRMVEHTVSPLEFRLGLLQSRLGPESDEYWTEVVKVLATAANALELSKHILPIAQSYPGSRDPVAARRALEKMVEDERRSMKSGQQKVNSPVEESGGRQTAKRIPKMTGPEIAVIRALVEPGLRSRAWEICLQPDMFATTVGAKIAQYLTASFSSVPEGAPIVWIGKIENEATKVAMGDLLMDDFHPITEGILEEAIASLASKRETREVHVQSSGEMDDARLKELHERLKRLKNTSSS